MNKYRMSEEEKKYLEQYDISRYKRPSLATDMAIFSVMEAAEAENFRKLPKKSLRILLVCRGTYPYKGSWALPGGFCRPEEDVSETARRELLEETGVQNAYLSLFGSFGEADRDPRGWVISNAFLALIDAGKYKLNAGTDAKEAAWFTVEVSSAEVKKEVKENYAGIETEYSLNFRQEETGVVLTAKVTECKTFCDYHERVSYSITESNGLAFDHAKVVLRAWQYLRETLEKDPRIAFDLMPEMFTLNQLQNAMELISGQELLTANFRRKIADYVIETEKMTEGKGHRPAKLFVRNLKQFYK
ncbi:MAG: NUDIX hydrolase [Lachnospiraceae bacterium]|nr:NUDIX hydrolase [Lachnospiraceae bacterium]